MSYRIITYMTLVALALRTVMSQPTKANVSTFFSEKCGSSRRMLILLLTRPFWIRTVPSVIGNGPVLGASNFLLIPSMVT